MNLVTALAVVIGALGAVATWLFLDPLAAFGLQIWAAFIGWASFYHCGGGEDGLRNSVLAGIWGAFMAAVAFALIPVVGLGAVGAAICVGVTVAIMILGAHVKLLSVIPAAVYGYAATAGFALLKSDASVTAAAIATNPFINIAISLAIGAGLGYVSEKIAKSIASG
jgi:hypothetical protein